MLSLIYSSHLGAEKCKRRAKEVLYWLTRRTTGVDRTDGGILFAKHVRMRAIRHYVGNTATKLRPQTQIRSGA